MEVIETSVKMGKDAFYWTTMGEISDVIGGGTPRTSDSENFVDGDIPWITPADLSGYTEKFIAGGKRHITSKGLASSAARMLPAGTVLFTSRAPIGYVAIAKNTIATNQGFKSFVLKEGVVPEYVYWWLKGSKQAAESLASGTTFLEISGANAKKLPIPMVSLARQREIVAEIEKQFSRLDEAVANLQRVKANLKRYKDSVYAEVFGNKPNCTLGDLIDEGPQNGLYLPKEMYGEGVPILRIDDYQTAWIRPLAELRRVKATQDQIATWALREDDLVINRVNSMTHLGKCALVPAPLAGTVFESNMMRMRLKTEVSPKYVEHYLSSRLGKTRLTENAKWAVNQASINQKDVRATPIFLPDLATQQQIVADIDRRLSIIKGTEVGVQANIKRSQALRQVTLASAFQVSPES
jgi:type I restriction enzyme, S subunit